MKNKEYNKKRDFSKTKEPKGNSRKKDTNSQIFVIQKHDATNLHYDFRLEIDNVLKSWSVPKGPSTDPSIKRMAIPTEDHPLEYANFEGTIPKGQYGGGTVMIWDKGTYKDLAEEGQNVSDSYKKGIIEFYLQGKKLQGGYSLIRMNSGKMKGNWLLIKKDDEKADARRNPVSTQNKSVTSNRTLKEIAKEEAK
ncbi:DNA polymerase ligase N-terminal domain-containing protein [Galbibacter pacificus]|uniref:DNA ligase n=1 Tax=Galbibacter pacificus TaxID=2996052 RepID=A0ABT6FPR6_9FLAO|nr:DNA polymerase ligase N-terminal domain-containing protein [Galbibacter pacificus]MDG3582276.1 DNA polymerase ligase N-terminal domain-containing protein [Galbibacter pacificus]MDG3585248.1 DNA ligase [Galbibacter pacificus]